MGNIYGDVKSTPVYNSGAMLEHDSMGKTPWGTGGNEQSMQENAKRRKTQKMSSTRRKGNSRKRISG